MKNLKKYYKTSIFLFFILLLSSCNESLNSNSNDSNYLSEFSSNNDLSSEISNETSFNSLISEEVEENIMYVKVNGHILEAELVNNSSTQGLIEKLNEGDLTINASDYGNFEKVGELGFSLPTNDERIVTEPGDIILYLGSRICFYYSTNTWNFTRLGKIQNKTKEELLEIYGSGDATFILSLNDI